MLDKVVVEVDFLYIRLICVVKEVDDKKTTMMLNFCLDSFKTKYTGVARRLLVLHSTSLKQLIHEKERIKYEL